MKKFLATLALALGLAVPSFGQANRYFDVSVPDPANFTLVPSTPMAQFPTGGFFANYIVSVPAGMTGLVLQFTTNSAGSDTLQLNTSCSPIPNYPDTQMISLPFLPVSRAQQTSYNFVAGLQSPAFTSASPQIISMPVLGCARIDIALGFNAANSGADLVTVSGNFTTSPAPMFAGGMTGTYNVIVDQNGTPHLAPYSINGANFMPVMVDDVVTGNAQSTAMSGFHDNAGNIKGLLTRSIYAATNITTTTQTNIGSLFLHTLTVNTPAAGTITIKDGCAGTSKGVVTVIAGTQPFTLFYDMNFATGICVTASVAMDYTVSWGN